MNPLTPDAVHQITTDRRREAHAAADAHRATREPGSGWRARWFGLPSLRVPLVARAGNSFEPALPRPRQA
jgi:hypothetical protein